MLMCVNLSLRPVIIYYICYSRVSCDDTQSPRSMRPSLILPLLVAACACQCCAGFQYVAMFIPRMYRHLFGAEMAHTCILCRRLYLHCHIVCATVATDVPGVSAHWQTMQLALLQQGISSFSRPYSYCQLWWFTAYGVRQAI